MTKHEVPTHGANAPQPVRTLRDWLDHLAARNRLAVLKPNIGLKFELAAYAKRLDGQRATMFPKPGGHAIPVVSGLVSDRGWSPPRCWLASRMRRPIQCRGRR